MVHTSVLSFLVILLSLLGQIEVEEIRGRLKKPIMIRTSPSVSPLIYVGSLLI